MDLINNLVFGNNILFELLICFIAGIISSFSPCMLTTIPIILTYISGDDKSGKSVKYSIFFSIGIIITFTLIGVVFALLGQSLKIFGNLWYMIIALLLIILSLQMFNAFPNNNFCKIPKLKRSKLGAFFLGIIGGFFSAPCSTPVLIAISIFIASKANVMLGIIYMIIYSIGFCVLILISGISIKYINKLVNSDKYIRVGRIIKYVIGIICIIVALYLVYIFI